jgi:hypothetical protein
MRGVGNGLLGLCEVLIRFVSCGFLLFASILSECFRLEVILCLLSGGELSIFVGEDLLLFPVVLLLGIVDLLVEFYCSKEMLVYSSFKSSVIYFENKYLQKQTSQSWHWLKFQHGRQFIVLRTVHSLYTWYMKWFYAF